MYLNIYIEKIQFYLILIFCHFNVVFTTFNFLQNFNVCGVLCRKLFSKSKKRLQFCSNHFKTYCSIDCTVQRFLQYVKKSVSMSGCIISGQRECKKLIFIYNGKLSSNTCFISWNINNYNRVHILKFSYFYVQQLFTLTFSNILHK